MRGILFGILKHVDTELSAHETMAAEQASWGSVAQLVAEYEALATAAQHDHWAAVVRQRGRSPSNADSRQFGCNRALHRGARSGRGLTIFSATASRNAASA